MDISKKKKLIKIAAIIITITVFLIIGLLFVQWRQSLKSPAGPEISLYLYQQKKVITRPMEEYLVGIVMAEMPVSFHSEALKAQAVCARTYTYYKLGQQPAHFQNAFICNDPGHCQAWIDPHQHASQQNINRVQTAVDSTCGQVLTFEGEPINAVYHSSCGGDTAAAEEVWGRSVPYLTSTKCPCPELSPYQEKKHTFPQQEFMQIFNIKKKTTPLVTKINISTSGRIKSVKIGGKTYNGNKMRQILNLPSTRVTIQEGRQQVIINSCGNGHGVGLCQYGAEALAEQGYDYQEILKYYYTGTDLYQIQY